jgi:hypothetical protein
MYEIQPYTRAKAKQAGLIIVPSKNPKKKIDVYDKNNTFLKSIGDISYSDYATYLKEEGAKKANERRRLYHLRHTKDSLGENLAKYLLW